MEDHQQQQKEQRAHVNTFDASDASIVGMLNIKNTYLKQPVAPLIAMIPDSNKEFGRKPLTVMYPYLEKYSSMSHINCVIFGSSMHTPLL